MSCGALIAFVSRLLYGFLFDKIGFKILMLFFLTLQLVNSITVFYAVHITPIYIIFQVCNYMVNAGFFVVLATENAKLFGIRYGPLVYSIVAFG